MIALGIPGPGGCDRIDFARTVWEKNEVNFSPGINVNLIILSLVGLGTSNRVSNELSYQEGSLYKVSYQKVNWCLNYLRLTKSVKIDSIAPLYTPFFHMVNHFLRKRLGSRPCSLAHLFYRPRSMNLV